MWLGPPASNHSVFPQEQALKTKSSKFAAVAVVAVMSATAAGASAATIRYDLTVTGSGLIGVGTTKTPFTDLTVHTTLYGDTTSVADDPGVARVVQFTAGSVTYSGITRVLHGNGNGGSSFVVYEGPKDSGVIGNGAFASGYLNGAFTLFNAFYSPTLAGYDGISNVAPVSVAPIDNLLGDPWLDERDTGIPNDYIDFYSVSRDTFSATVPEPAVWAMMLLGFGGLGGALRMARRKTRAAIAA
jgi:hypothetical protein